ncbi:hypothetical protein TraAM80_06216 [Trypanosoma rangeli]|uniref:Uncharacterized protein n=1 Tax=Trypanosoma rangeli TaxID=5698 RepID=A0A422NB40_TRYRA|nr:uncharacterized protein TraAM80_06216 [Trypanosoma rangeli]RNF02694.1 hypothetical protein TraAM80_06216 [Trypanosoma rangeli]|eukprot:RNF02694.1 hypothetical protein TraAM80_06216 [Trypanosoma rangeli]
MAFELRRRLCVIADYLDEGEALFNETFANKHDDDTMPCQESHQSTESTFSALMPTSLATVPDELRMTNEVQRILRTGREVHERVRDVLREAAMNPAFTFAALRC